MVNYLVFIGLIEFRLDVGLANSSFLFDVFVDTFTIQDGDNPEKMFSNPEYELL